MPKLIFSGEQLAGRVYELRMEKTTVGRGDHNTLSIHDNSVSQSHCEILVNGPEVIVRDLGSANGTFVNGVRVSQQCQVKSEQTLRFGSVEARLELDPPPTDDTATEETAVFAMRRSMRDMRRERANPKPASAAMTIESDSDSVPSDHTVVMKRPPPTEAEALAPEKPASAARTQSGSRAMIVMAALLGLGLVILLWLVWGRK